MTDYSTYRETPRTGRTPEYSGHEHSPNRVDPGVLTDDRDNPDLLTFERTWGHRVLAGLGVAMIVIAVLLVVYSIVQLVRLYDLSILAPDIAAMGMWLYACVLVGGLALVVPAIIGIYVAKHPARVAIAIVAAAVALALVVAFFVYAVVTAPQFPVAAVLYSLLLAVLPVIYLLAALKIKRSL